MLFRSGKSLLTKIMMKATPRYASPFNLNLSCLRVSTFGSANEHNDGKVMIGDTRILLSSEGQANMTVDSEDYKRITSQDSFYARECGEKQSLIEPEGTLFYFGQNPILFDKNDKAVQRRRRGFPWKVKFPECKDGSLDYLETVEAFEAFDDWLIQEGYSLWKAEGFSEIEELKLFQEELNEEEDPFKNMLEATFEIVDDKENKDNWVLASKVYELFKPCRLQEYGIKRKFEEYGVHCKCGRGNEGNKMYFRGLKRTYATFTVNTEC